MVVIQLYNFGLFKGDCLCYLIVSMSNFSPSIRSGVCQAKCNKTKVKSVHLGKTLSYVKFVVEWGWVGGGGRGKTLNCSSLTLKRPKYQILASCYA